MRFAAAHESARLKAQSFLIDGEVVIARDDRTPGGSTLVQRAISFQRQWRQGCLSQGSWAPLNQKVSSALAVLIVRVWGRDRVGVSCPCNGGESAVSVCVT